MQQETWQGAIAAADDAHKAALKNGTTDKVKAAVELCMDAYRAIPDTFPKAKTYWLTTANYWRD